MVDGGVEVEEGEGRRKVVAVGGRPVAGRVDSSGRGGGDALQLLFQRRSRGATPFQSA